VPSPFRDEIRLSKDETIDVLVTLEDARQDLERRRVWTTLPNEIAEREAMLSDRRLW
jgi:hypothetical protein